MSHSRKRSLSHKVGFLRPTKNGFLLNEGSAIRKTSKEPWTCNTRGTIGWNEGVHSWSVTLDNSLSMSAGICLEDIHETDCSRNNDKRMDIYCYTGEIVIGEGPKVGDTLTFLLDMHEHKLLVAINGRWLKMPVLTDIPEGTWYPYLCLEDKGAQATLVYA